MLAKRKQEHLHICLHEEVGSATSTGLERYRLVHEALPELSLQQISTACAFLGHNLQAPLLISSMTGGAPEAWQVNLRLATAAQELGLAMGVGSQRAGIEDAALMDTYRLRQVAPDILLLANLGAVQLNYGYGIDACKRAVESIGADGLILHLNPLQEALQPDGNTRFEGLLARISEICQQLPVPVIVKEVGGGISPQTARRLQAAGVAAIDVAGAGGTSWSEVERLRSRSAEDAEVAEAFAAWGIPTADALVGVRSACPALPLIASGGIRTGIDVAVCLALGADLVGLAHALLPSAAQSVEQVSTKLRVIIRQLRIAMFCCGAGSLASLDGSRVTLRSDQSHGS